MATRMVVCPECREAVPFGRLACSECGALLASVAGSEPASPTIVDGPDEAPELEPELEPEPATIAAPEPPGYDPAAYDPAAYDPAASPETVGPQPRPGAWIPPATQPDDEEPAPSVSPAVASPAAPSPAETQAGARAAAPGISVQRAEEVADRFVFLGAAVAAAAFVLPWSSVVIGAEGFGGYLDTWGLANPSHALVLVGALIVAGLGYLRPRIVGPWLRSGFAGIALGSLLLGLVWPYLLGPLGASIGVVVEAISALVLVVGGIAAVWAARHGDRTSPV